MKLRLMVTLFFLMSCLTIINAGNGYDIKIKINGYDNKHLMLAYHLGDKQYIKDSVEVNSEGIYEFKADTLLPAGVYLVVMKPDNVYFQVLIESDNQVFTVNTTKVDPTKNIKFKGSKENEVFYEYMNFLSLKKPLADSIRANFERDKNNPNAKTVMESELKKINDDVVKYQKDVTTKYPKYLMSSIIKSTMDVPVPEFTGDAKEVDYKKYYYLREHWFDNIDLTDDRLLRSPVHFNKVDYYVNKLTAQHPDSINVSIDYVLNKVSGNSEIFKFYLIYFLNTYANSKIVGMDAVYVHVAQQYYAKGKAPWVNQDDLDKIIDNANRLEPILIGKKAPNIQMQKRDGTKVSLYDMTSDYTVLIFWQPDCGHCKKEVPNLVKINENLKGKGVDLFVVCTKTHNVKENEVPKCWDFIDEHKMDGFLNVVDPYLLSKFNSLYDVVATPAIFILDKNKEIVSKRIGIEQIEDVMGKLIEFNKKKELEKGK